jgi:SAM-dependent methyltransferase
LRLPCAVALAYHRQAPVRERQRVVQVVEDLQREAREVHAIAARHCAAPGQADCGWYHSSLPTLRLLGVFDSPGSDDDFLLPAFEAELQRGARRILVSGCADAAMLARVAACLPGVPVCEIVVLDRCRTPLELCRDYAARHGLAIELVHSDILDYRAAPFDLICTHSFLSFFDAPARGRLAQAWWSLLRPGGCVVTAQRIRTGAAPGLVGYGESESLALADDAVRRAGEDGNGAVGADAARACAQAWTRNYFAHVIGSEQELRAPFEAVGFALEQCAPGRAPGSDRPGTPRQGAGSRWRIVARRAGGAMA